MSRRTRYVLAFLFGAAIGATVVYLPVKACGMITNKVPR